MQLPDEEISYINIVQNQTNEKITSIKKINKGTLSRVFLLNDKYILKIANSIFIKREIIYLGNNESEYNEKIVYIDKEYRFIVYKYIQGNDVEEFSHEEAIQNFNVILDLSKKYRKAVKKPYGYIYEEKGSWYSFLKSGIVFNNVYLPDNFIKSEEDFLNKALEKIKNVPVDARYIHGDLGMHNIIFENNIIKGIIDPATAIGDYRYDAVYFVLSSVKIANHIDYHYLMNALGSDIISLVIIILYGRISKSYKYNLGKEDTDFFESLWYKLKNELENIL